MQGNLVLVMEESALGFKLHPLLGKARAINTSREIKLLILLTFPGIVLQLLQKRAGILCFQQDPQGLSMKLFCYSSQTLNLSLWLSVLLFDHVAFLPHSQMS